MKIGKWTLVTLLESTFRLDGGSMFGIVPRQLWARLFPPDEQNRILMALRVLLLSDGQRHILIDAGIGNRFSGKQQEIYQVRPCGDGIRTALARLGLSAEDITDCITTHLHFDHVAGLLTPDPAGKLRPTFPNAMIYIQEEGWRFAKTPSLWDQASFFQDDFERWEDEMNLQFLQGDCEIEQGIRVLATCGHTPGHQVVVIGEGERSAVFCGDLIPTAAHVRLPYIMAYDQQPLETLEEKEALLAQALEENWVLIFEHDPYTTAHRLEEKSGKIVVGEAVCINLP